MSELSLPFQKALLLNSCSKGILLTATIVQYQLESSNGVVISMGGQTANNIALPLHRLNVKVLGTAPEMIDMVSKYLSIFFL